MRDHALIDTGAILAILDPDDEWHRVCGDTLRTLRLPLITSEAVMTEVFHMILRNRRETETAWRFLLSGAVRVVPIEHNELPELHMLMSQYRDRPMDFADATLVHLARRATLSTIFTVDFADFEIYRIDGRRRFRILPERYLP